MLIHSSTLWAQEPHLSYGQLKRYTDFPSKHVKARTVDVWLPEGYSPNKKYPVLYMHDGQMLFDANVTWNKQEWKVDETIGQLIQEHRIPSCIVVGVWNTDLRHAEYMPQKPIELLPAATQDTLYHSKRPHGGPSAFPGKVRSDLYLKFLVEELKPFIDKTFSTRKEQKHTFIAGSSMGGLISLYALCEYPKIFGGAACLSTHWPGIFTDQNNPIPGALLSYLGDNLPSPKKHKLYFDYGTATLDSLYKPYQQAVDALMRTKGYDRKHWMTQEFPGKDHSENAWAERLSIPMLFLMGKDKE